MPVPTHECIEELALWYRMHRRAMTRKVMRSIVQRHFPAKAEASSFYRYLESPPGQRIFTEALRRQLGKVPS